MMLSTNVEDLLSKCECSFEGCLKLNRKKSFAFESYLWSDLVKFKRKRRGISLSKKKPIIAFLGMVVDVPTLKDEC